MVDPGVDVVDDVLEHDGDRRVGSPEQGGVGRDLLTDNPEHAVAGGLGGAGPEQLRPVEPDGGDSIVLLAAAGGGELEHDGVPGAGAQVWRGVGGGGRREAVGVGEGVGEEGGSAGRGEAVGGEWASELEVLSRAGCVEGGQMAAEEVGAATTAGGGGGGEEGLEEEEKEGHFCKSDKTGEWEYMYIQLYTKRRLLIPTCLATSLSHEIGRAHV